MFVLLQIVENPLVMGEWVLIVLSLLLLAGIASIPSINIGFKVVGLPPIQRKYKDILGKYFRYYQHLPPDKKKLFEKRVQHFINIKHFIPRGMGRATDEMKALIAASAIQLTFGLPKIYLSHFKRILIYPDDYYSTINKVYHRGEVNPLGRLIVLSWKNFVKGYMEHGSGINLGLHEMAHALHLENYILNDEYRFFAAEDLSRWNHFARYEMDKVRHGEETIFRQYGGENREEFFAVVVENFFERPAAFAKNHVELYHATVRLLNQNPLDYY